MTGLLTRHYGASSTRVKLILVALLSKWEVTVLQTR